MFKTWLLALIFIFSCSAAPASAETKQYKPPVCITVNNTYIRTDTPAFLENGYTQLPIRAVSDALCADSVTWDRKTNSAHIKRGNKTVSVSKNSKKATVNGKTVYMDTSATIHNDRFYVPVRFIAETFGSEVFWDASTYTVNLHAPDITVPSHSVGNRGYTEDDLYWLSRIIHAESEGESMTGKIAVGNVVINRVKSPLFSNNIYDVIFDRKYGVQFTPTANGAIYKTPSGDSIAAAKLALSGENTAGSSLYFLNPAISTSFWIVNNRPFYKSIGNHDFYL